MRRKQTRTAWDLPLVWLVADLAAHGVTDELSKKVVADPVSIPDFHATMLAALGIDPTLELMAGSRPVPATDGGTPIAKLFA